MNSRTFSRNKRTSINLIDEYQDTRLFATKRTVGKRIVKKYHIVLKREPRFSLERSADTDCEFIRLTRDNRLVGLIKNGEFERNGDVEKLFFLGKLDLKPNDPKNKTDFAGSLRSSSNSYGSTTPDDYEVQSCISSSPPPSPSPPESRSPA